jgi:hypothetical protein
MGINSSAPVHAFETKKSVENNALTPSPAGRPDPPRIYRGGYQYAIVDGNLRLEKALEPLQDDSETKEINGRWHVVSIEGNLLQCSNAMVVNMGLNDLKHRRSRPSGGSPAKKLKPHTLLLQTSRIGLVPVDGCFPLLKVVKMVFPNAFVTFVNHYHDTDQHRRCAVNNKFSGYGGSQRGEKTGYYKCTEGELQEKLTKLFALDSAKISWVQFVLTRNTTDTTIPDDLKRLPSSSAAGEETPGSGYPIRQWDTAGFTLWVGVSQEQISLPKKIRNYRDLFESTGFGLFTEWFEVILS